MRIPGTFHSGFDQSVERHPDRPALVLPDEAEVTYAQLSARVDRVVRVLMALGVERGDTVATLMANCGEHVTAILAASRVGALCVPVNTRYRSTELAFVIENSFARVVLTSLAGSEYSDLPDRLLEAMDGGNATPHLMMLGERQRQGFESLDDVEVRLPMPTDEDLRLRRSQVEPDDLAIMLYTSGTTALPKGCPMLHRQLDDVGRQIGDRLGVTDADRVWDALPLFHASSLLPMVAAFAHGGLYITQPTPEPGLSLDMIEKHRATALWPAFTQIWQAILAQPEFPQRDLSSVRSALCIGPPETVALLESRLPNVPLLSCYGITEGTGVPTMVRHDDPAEIRQGTGGLPFEGFEAMVVEPGWGADLPRGEVGELKIRGSNVFKGYWMDPDNTAVAFDAEGWFHTGDLATMDEAGRVSYEGRLKDMLKVGGENVGALEIEALLCQHPAVQTAAVVGAPDPRLAEVPAAFVELKPDAMLTEPELIEFCRGRIASFKVPRYVRFVTEWPLSTTKIRKIDLRERIANELA